MNAHSAFKKVAVAKAYLTRPIKQGGNDDLEKEALEMLEEVLNKYLYYRLKEEEKKDDTGQTGC